MRELLCNFFYLFINAYFCYFCWRGSWLAATQLLRDEIETKQETFLFLNCKNAFKKISSKLCNTCYFGFKNQRLHPSLKIISKQQDVNDFSFFHFYLYTFWFLFLSLIWLFISYPFEIFLVNIPMW